MREWIKSSISFKSKFSLTSASLVPSALSSSSSSSWSRRLLLPVSSDVQQHWHTDDCKALLMEDFHRTVHPNCHFIIFVSGLLSLANKTRVFFLLSRWTESSYFFLFSVSPSSNSSLFTVSDSFVSPVLNWSRMRCVYLRTDLLQETQPNAVNVYFFLFLLWARANIKIY